MREAEALAKWCPFSRVAAPMHSEAEGTNGNRWPTEADPTGTQHQSESCIAGRCMAWRWDGTHVSDPDNPKGDMVWSDRSYGHCGLAGDQQPGRASSLENRRAEAGQ